LERVLDDDGHWKLFSYDDAQCEFPERLVAEWLAEAVEAGAVARNHTQVLEVTRNNGRVAGVIARDLLSGQEFSVSTRQVVNAAGPWVDSVLTRCGVKQDKPLIGGVRGSHIVLAAFESAPNAAIYTEAADGRPVFVIPWNGMLLVGTTEKPDQGDPGKAQADASEIDYLLGAFNSLLPSHAATRADIVYSYAGVRPLPYVDDLAPSAITRRHLIYEHEFDGAAGMLSIVGGKLTTAGSLARECARKLKLNVPEPASVMVAAPAASGIEVTLRQWARQVAAVAGIPEASALAIAEWHGRNALCIARLAQRDDRLRKPICQHSQHLLAEAINALTHEHAVSAADILLRRVPVALSGTWTEECSSTAIQRIGEAAGWSAARQAKEFEDFELERKAFLVRQSWSKPETAVSLGRPE
jgi:glycerol-3-phosphate dehydrogenase